jgi:hypothetical protein
VRRLVLLVAVAIAVTACSAEAGERLDSALIIDADPDGAIIYDGKEKAYLGVRRDGSVAWRTPGGPDARVPAGCLARCPETTHSVGGTNISWRESVDGLRALRITRLPSGNHGEWFDLDPGGWRPAGLTIHVAGATACVGPDGQRALLVGQRPALVDRAGHQEPVTDLELAGTCALGSAGGIVADLFQAGGGLRSDIRVFGGEHAVTWRGEVAGETVVSADPLSHRVSYTSGGSLHELDSRTGGEVRVVAGVRAGRYDRTGVLVVVRSGGQVAWLG